MSDDTQNLDEPSTTEVLVADEVAQKPEKPEGSPSFLPPGAMTHRQRADFFNALRTVDLDTLGGMQVDTNAVDLSAVADLFVTIASIVDAMSLIVVPGARSAYKTWSDNANGQQLIRLFAWYMAEFDLGEAIGSPS